MKNKYIYIPFFFLFLCLTACADSQTYSMTKLSELIPSEYQYQGSNLRIDLSNIYYGTEEYVYDGYTTRENLDYANVARTLIPKGEENAIDTGEGRIVLMNSENEEKESAYYNMDYLEYQTNHGAKYTPSVREQKYEGWYNLDAYTTPKSFEFGTEHVAYADIQNILQTFDLDISQDYTYSCYYLDHVTLEEQEYYIDMDGQRINKHQEWTKEDDAYLFFIHKTYCGLRDYQKEPFIPNYVEDCYAQIVLVYSCRGIECLRISNLNSYTKENNGFQLMEFETIMDNLKLHYENILDGYEREVVYAELIVDSDNGDIWSERRVKPVWAFSVMETNGESEMLTELRIDAITGELYE